MARNVTYSNIWSRLLMRSLFDNQWVLPVSSPGLIHRFFRWYERHAMRIDTRNIGVDRPVFLISLPRSGSSMLQDIICAHPDVAYITNMMYMFPDCFCAAERLRQRFGFNIRGERFLQDSVEVDGGSPADPVGMWATWLKLDPYSLAYSECRISDFTAQEIESIREAIRRVLWCFGGRASRFECKTPALAPHIAILHEMFPDAKFIHLVRDARMNANSMIKLHRLCNQQLERIRERVGVRIPAGQPFVPYPRLPALEQYLREFGPEDIRTTAHIWDDCMRFMAQAQPRIRNFHEVRYEDILARPKETVLALLDFCELSRPADGDSAFWRKLGGVGAVHHKNVYGNFGAVEEICRETMLRHGYL